MDYINFDANLLDRESLEHLLNYHNNNYWNKGELEIDDKKYDTLLIALKKIDPTNPLLSKIFTPKVSSIGKIVHKKPLLSLDKAYSLSEIMEWANKHARNSEELFLIEPKYDGISAIFENGILATRGDGNEGENISDKIPLIEFESANKCGALKDNLLLNLRGEILVRNDKFNIIQEKIRPKGITYKNSRNILTGFMTFKEQKYISQLEFAMQHYNAFLTLVDYDLHSVEILLGDIESQWDSIQADFEALPYPLDGIVVKLADKAYSMELGNTAHHPRGEIAFKFQNVEKSSKLIAVNWSAGKNCLTPVAEIEPVDIGGITIRHATLHNYQNVLERDIHINDNVIIERAGDVIPYIKESSAGDDRKSCLITNCPYCEAVLVRQGPEICCINPDCFESNLQRLCAAVKSIGIEELGEPNIRQMMSILDVKNLQDIFNLTKTDLEKLSGFKTKKINNLFDEIQKARNIKDYQLLASLNIAHVGINMAKLILKEHSIDKLFEMSEEDFCAIKGIGIERAKALVSELDMQKDYIMELKSTLIMKKTQGDIVHKTICFTGKMVEKRSFYESIALANDYEIASVVNSSLTTLVANDINEKSSKIAKAKNLNVELVSLDEWLKKVTIPEALQKKEPEAVQGDLFDF